LPVEVLEDGRAAAGGYLQNVSLSGALLKSSRPLQLHALIAVRIELLASSENSTGIMARVSRTPGQKFGLEWCEFAPAAVKDLLRLQSGRSPP
jgi:hypothetical protein